MRKFSKPFMKRVTSTLLAALLVTGIVPTLAFAEDIHTDTESPAKPSITQEVYGQPKATKKAGQPTNELRMPFSLSADGQGARAASADPNATALQSNQKQPFLHAKGSAPVKKELILTSGTDQVTLTYANQYNTNMIYGSTGNDLIFEITGLDGYDYYANYSLIFTNQKGEKLETSVNYGVADNVKIFYASSHPLFFYGSYMSSFYNFSGTVELRKSSYWDSPGATYTSNGQLADFKVSKDMPLFYKTTYFAKDSLVTPYAVKVYGDYSSLPTNIAGKGAIVDLVDSSNQLDAVHSSKLWPGMANDNFEHSESVLYYGDVFQHSPSIRVPFKMIIGEAVFVNPPAEGETYMLQAADKQGQSTPVLPGILQATESPIINGVLNQVWGYPAAAPGNQSFYIQLTGIGLKLEMFDIKLLSEYNPLIQSVEIAHAVDSRYDVVNNQTKITQMVVRMDIAAGAELKEGQYYILSIAPKNPDQIIYNNGQTPYINVKEKTEFHGMELINDPLYADFNVYAYVPKAEEGKKIRVDLAFMNNTKLVSQETSLTSKMHLQFYDEKGQLFKLDTPYFYDLRFYDADNGSILGSITQYTTSFRGPVGGGSSGGIGGGGGIGGKPAPVVFPDTGDKSLQPLTAENLPLDFNILPTAMDAGGEERLELTDLSNGIVVATLSGEKLAKGQPVDVAFGSETHAYIPVIGEFPAPEGLHEGYYRLDWVGKSSKTNITDYYFYQSSKIYATSPSSNLNQSKVTMNYSVFKTRELDPSAFSVQVVDLLDREIEGIVSDIRPSFDTLDRTGYEAIVTMPVNASQGHYQVRLSYNSEPVYSAEAPSSTLWDKGTKYFEFTLNPIFKYFGTSFRRQEDSKINPDAYMYAYLSNVPGDAQLKALVYSGSLLKTSAVVHQLNLVKSTIDMPNAPYTFSQESLAGLDLTKRYSLVLYLNDQPIASLDNKLIDGEPLPEQIPVTEVSLSSSAFSLNVGQEATLTATIAPANATNKAVTWSSSNPAVATVDAAGKVHAVAAGSTTITAKAGDHTATATITVNSSGSGGGGGGYAGPGPASSSSQTIKLGDIAITPKVDDKQNYAFAPSADEFAKLAGQNGQAQTELSLQFTGLPADAKGVDLAFKTEWLPAKTERLVISAPEIGTWTMGSDTLKQLFAGKTVSLSLRKGSLKAELLIDGKAYTTENEQQPFSFSMPYEVKAGEQAGTLVVVRVKVNGEKQILPRSSYDSAKKVMRFLSPVAGYFEVVANPVTLADVSANAWYKPAIDYMAAHDTLSVKAGQKFMPKQEITRAEFVVMLMKTLGFSPDTQLTDNFSDAGTQDAAGYLAAAKRLGLIAGVGNNRFAPDERISRQDMFVILYQALEKISLLPAGGKGQSLAGFKDAASVAEYSRKALGYFVSAGVVSGDGKLILPKSNTTKAEAAQVLYNIFAKAN